MQAAAGVLARHSARADRARALGRSSIRRRSTSGTSRCIRGTRRASALFGGLLALHLAALWAVTLVLAAAPARWRLPWRSWRTRRWLVARLGAARRDHAAADRRPGLPACPPTGTLVSLVACARRGAGRPQDRDVVSPRHRGRRASCRCSSRSWSRRSSSIRRSTPLAERATRQLDHHAVCRAGAEPRPAPAGSRGPDAATKSIAIHGCRASSAKPPTRSARRLRSSGRKDQAGAAQRVRRLAGNRLEPRAADVGHRALRPQRRAGQPLRAQLPRVHSAAVQKPRMLAVLPMGDVRRGAAVRLRRAQHAARGAQRLRCRRCNRRHHRRARDARLPQPALHHARRARISSCSGRRESREPRRRARPAATSRSRSTAGGCTRSTARARRAWPIDETLFARIYDPSAAPVLGRRSRAATAATTSTSRTIAFFIYAIGYPALTLFDHLVHLAELTTLAGVVVRVRAARRPRCSRAPARERPRVGRALLREIRASFYRKLFLAFVLAAVLPVLTLAFVIRAYFADQLRAPCRPKRCARRRSRSASSRSRTRCAQRSDGARAARRRRHGVDQPADRSGRQHLRRRRSCWRRASATSSRRACCRRARRTTSTARSCCERLPSFVGRGRDRRPSRTCSPRRRCAPASATAS